VSKSKFIAHARRGFTLIELLVVITIILLISGLFLGISPGDGGGLKGGQRIIASTIRSVRAMALMNRGGYTSNITYNGRYRLLILNDPTDPVNHLHQFVVAVGYVDPSQVSAGVDPSSITNTTITPYVWFAPEQPTNLPNGVYFIPPSGSTSSTTTVNGPVDPDSGTRTDISDPKYRSFIGSIADLDLKSTFDNTQSPPMMAFTPVNQPQVLDSTGKSWYYIELQNSGASNHLGKVVLILANAKLFSDGKTATLDIQNINQFAFVVIRPNGDVAISNDSEDINTKKLQ
jgi:prepilin-type N-terminal cleavage/methylation domain-containing protein